VKKIHADLSGEINISRSSTLSTEKPWWCSCPENQVTVPKHAERAKRTGLRRLLDVFGSVGFDLIIARRKGLFFQRVFTTRDPEVRGRFSRRELLRMAPTVVAGVAPTERRKPLDKMRSAISA
jgi:hypothetical protein